MFARKLFVSAFGMAALLGLSACNDVNSPTFIPQLQTIQVCELPANGVCPQTACPSAFASLPVGLDKQFCALGTYSGVGETGSSGFIAPQVRNISGLVDWSSQDATRASVSANGLVRALAQTPAVEIRAGLSGVNGSASLEVTPAVLQGVEINPNGQVLPRLVVGTTRAFRCFGRFSGPACGGSDFCDVTASAQFDSSDEGVAEFSSSSDTGVLSALAEGNSTISCDFGGVNSSPDASVTVCPVDPDAVLSITPATVNALPIGNEVQYTATLSFTDCVSNNPVTQNVTEFVVWSSTRPDIASIDENTGLAVGIAPGTTEVNAEFQGVEAESATLTVLDADLLRLEIDGPAVVLSGITLAADYTAQAIFRDPDTGEELDPVDVSADVDIRWSTSDADAIVFTDATSGAASIAADAEPGVVTIRADYRGLSDTHETSVVMAEVTGLESIPNVVCVGGAVDAGFDPIPGLDLDDPIQLNAFALVRFTDADDQEQSCSTKVTDLADWSDVVNGTDLLNALGLGGVLGSIPGLGDILAGLVGGECPPLLPANLGLDPTSAPVVVTNTPPKGVMSGNPDVLLGTACVAPSYLDFQAVTSVVVAADLQNTLPVCSLLLSTNEPSLPDCGSLLAGGGE